MTARRRFQTNTLAEKKHKQERMSGVHVFFFSCEKAHFNREKSGGLGKGWRRRGSELLKVLEEASSHFKETRLGKRMTSL